MAHRTSQGFECPLAVLYLAQAGSRAQPVVLVHALLLAHESGHEGQPPVTWQDYLHQAHAMMSHLQVQTATTNGNVLMSTCLMIVNCQYL